MLEIQLVDYTKARGTIHEIRHQVFTLEQHVDSELDFDGQDENAFQVIAYANNKPAGTGRMLSDGHIGRIAVLGGFRKLGAGTLIVNTLIELARERKFFRVFLGAQVLAMPFYEKLGFTAYGETYMEAGILHMPMEIDLETP